MEGSPLRERLFPVIALMMAVFVLSAMMGATFLPVALAEGQEADELLTEEVLPDTWTCIRRSTPVHPR